MEPWQRDIYERQMAQDMHDIAESARARQRGPLGGYRPQRQQTHVNIDLTPIVVLVRAWNRFARRRLPKPVHITINTIVILVVVLVVFDFVRAITGH